MPKIKILPHHEICPEGGEIQLQVGDNLCEGLLNHGFAIEHACDMSKACTTCHVVIKQGFTSLAEMDDVEADLLDRAWGLQPESRLSCQVKIQKTDLTIEIPKYSINHAKENH